MHHSNQTNPRFTFSMDMLSIFELSYWFMCCMLLNVLFKYIPLTSRCHFCCNALRKNLDLCFSLMVYKQWAIFNAPYLLWQEALVFVIISMWSLHFSSFIQKSKSTEDLFFPSSSGGWIFWRGHSTGTGNSVVIHNKNMILQCFYVITRRASL